MGQFYSKNPKQTDQENLDSLYHFFRRNLRQAFADLRVGNQQTLNYIASILTQFTRTDNLFRIKHLPRFKLESVVESLLDIEVSRHTDDAFSENEEILIRKHIADFTLFMTGIFREYVQHMGHLDFYLQEGRRSYHRISDYADQKMEEKTNVFRDLF